jgi:hypothetical protein
MTAGQEGGLAGPSPELDLPAVRAHVEGELGQRRAVGGVQQRQRLATGGRAPLPGNEHLNDYLEYEFVFERRATIEANP